jgi:hypothetical protein
MKKISLISVATSLLLLLSGCVYSDAPKNETTAPLFLPQTEPQEEYNEEASYEKYENAIYKCWNKTSLNSNYIEPTDCSNTILEGHDYEVISSGDCSSLQVTSLNYDYTTINDDYGKPYCAKSTEYISAYDTQLSQLRVGDKNADYEVVEDLLGCQYEYKELWTKYIEVDTSYMGRTLCIKVLR